MGTRNPNNIKLFDNIRKNIGNKIVSGITSGVNKVTIPADIMWLNGTAKTGEMTQETIDDRKERAVDRLLEILIYDKQISNNAEYSDLRHQLMNGDITVDGLGMNLTNVNVKFTPYFDVMTALAKAVTETAETGKVPSGYDDPMGIAMLRNFTEKRRAEHQGQLDLALEQSAEKPDGAIAKMMMKQVPETEKHIATEDAALQILAAG